MSYYRHRVSRYYYDNGNTSDMGWKFSDKCPSDFMKELDKKCREHNEGHPHAYIKEWITISHEIHDDSCNEYSLPLKQYIFSLK